jgi:hypothetical protein
VRDLTFLAVRVEFFAEKAQMGALNRSEDREREGIKTAGFIVTRIIANAKSAPSGKGPNDMSST